MKNHENLFVDTPQRHSTTNEITFQASKQMILSVMQIQQYNTNDLLPIT